MIRWRLLLPWLLRAWPVLAVIPVSLAHAIALRFFAAESIIVNKVVGMFLQVLGGLLVLYSVNDNLGHFRAQSLPATMIAWFKGFPFVRKPISLSTSIGAVATATASMSAVVFRAAHTLEERIEELERKLSELEGQIQREVQEINSRIQVARLALEQQIAATSNNVTDLSKRLEHAAVGGFKVQALGVLLVIYGAITSLFT